MVASPGADLSDARELARDVTRDVEARDGIKLALDLTRACELAE
jgi:hypothetical protein